MGYKERLRIFYDFFRNADEGEFEFDMKKEMVKGKSFKDKMDAGKRGGAPLLGIAKPVIKAHGNSDAFAFKNAINQAKIFVETDINGTISAALAKAKEEKEI